MELKKEIELAQSLLLENIKKTTNGSISNSLSTSLKDPVATVSLLNLGAQNFLDKDNPLRKIIKYATLILGAFQMQQKL